MGSRSRRATVCGEPAPAGGPYQAGGWAGPGGGLSLGGLGPRRRARASRVRVSAARRHRRPGDSIQVVPPSESGPQSGNPTRAVRVRSAQSIYYHWPKMLQKKYRKVPQETSTVAQYRGVASAAKCSRETQARFEKSWNETGMPAAALLGGLRRVVPVRSRRLGGSASLSRARPGAGWPPFERAATAGDGALPAPAVAAVWRETRENAV